MEQRYRAVLEVLNDGATVTDVARRYEVARKTVHEWLRKYAQYPASSAARASIWKSLAVMSGSHT